jgi:hypothetical protein
MDDQRRGKVFRWFERVVLSAAMSAIAFVAERRILKALKQGTVKPAPRTAAEGEPLGESFGLDPMTGSATPAEQVPDQP